VLKGKEKVTEEVVNNIQETLKELRRKHFQNFVIYTIQSRTGRGFNKASTTQSSLSSKGESSQE